MQFSGFKNCFALQRPYLWAPHAEQMEILRGDDLSPTALDAYELVKTFVPPVIPEVRSLLHCLGNIMATCLDVMPCSRTSYMLLLTQSAANVCLLCIRFFPVRYHVWSYQYSACNNAITHAGHSMQHIMSLVKLGTGLQSLISNALLRLRPYCQFRPGLYLMSI